MASSSGSIVGVGQAGRAPARDGPRRPSGRRRSGSSPSERTAMTCSGASARSSSSTGSDPLDALVVGDQHLRARVGEAVLHLGGRPPRVHADDGGADRHDRPVAERPTRGSCASRWRPGRRSRHRGRRAGDGRAPARWHRPRRTCSARPRTRCSRGRRTRASSQTKRIDGSADSNTLIGTPRTLISLIANCAPAPSARPRPVVLLDHQEHVGSVSLARIESPTIARRDGSLGDDVGRGDVSLWVSDRCHAVTPAAVRQVGRGRPVTHERRRTGRRSRSTQTSWKPNAPRPRPERLHHRLACGEPGRQRRHRVGLRRDVGQLVGGEQPLAHRRRACQRSPEPFDVDDVDPDARSRRRTVTLDLARASRRQWSAVSEIGSMSRSSTGSSASSRLVEVALGLRHPVDEAVVAAVVALQHAAHRRRRRAGRGTRTCSNVMPVHVAGLDLGHEDRRCARRCGPWRRAPRARRRPGASCRRSSALRSTRLGRSREMPPRSTIEIDRRRRCRSG